MPRFIEKPQSVSECICKVGKINALCVFYGKFYYNPYLLSTDEVLMNEDIYLVNEAESSA